MVYENFTVKNVGSLALKYRLTINVGGFNTVVDNGKSLKDVLKVAILDEVFTGDRTVALGLTYDKTIEDFVHDGTLLAGAADKTYGIVIYWEPSDVDNDYNLNNGKTSSDDNPLFIDLGVTLTATQDTVEKDSFDEQYDKDAWLAMTAKNKENGTYESDGQLYVKDENKFVAVEAIGETEGLYKAENGDKYVATVAAFDAVAPEGGNITVLDNIEKKFEKIPYGNVLLDNTVPFLEAKTDTDIDLGSKTVTIQSDIGRNGIKVSDGANVTISNGTITMNKAYGSGYPVVSASHAEITLDNMTVTNSTKDGVCASAGSDGGKLVIKNSVVTGGGQYSAAVFCGSQSNVVIENSTIVGCIRAETNGTIIIKSGDFTRATFYFGGSGTRTVYAGTFADDPRNLGLKVDAGSTVTNNGDGTWTVTAG